MTDQDVDPDEDKQRHRDMALFTSEQAVPEIEDITEVQRMVLAMFWTRGHMIDETLVRYAEAFGIEASPQSLRSRRSELVDQGLLLRTGETRKTTNGGDAYVWGLTDDGREVAQDIIEDDRVEPFWKDGFSDSTHLCEWERIDGGYSTSCGKVGGGIGAMILEVFDHPYCPKCSDLIDLIEEG